MTAPPKFGDAIPTNGVRLPWLPSDVHVSIKIDGEFSRLAHSSGDFYYDDITAIRLEVPRYDFVYLALERGMVPYFGMGRLVDWDGGPVLLSSGTMYEVPPGEFWTRDTDIIGYTRKATSTALPLAHPAVPQGEDMRADNLKRTLTDALHFAVCTLAYHGRDRGTDRQEGMLDDLEQMARELDVNARAALAALAPAAIASGQKGAEPMWSGADCPRCDGERVINVEDRPHPNDISPSTHQEPCPECTA